MANIPLNFRAMTVLLDSSATSTRIDFLEADLSYEVLDPTEYVTNNGALTTQTLQGIEQPVTFSFTAKCVDDQLVSTVRPEIIGGTKDLQFLHGWSSVTKTNFYKVSADVSWNSSDTPNMLSITGRAAGYKEGSDTFGGQSA